VIIASTLMKYYQSSDISYCSYLLPLKGILLHSKAQTFLNFFPCLSIYLESQGQILHSDIFLILLTQIKSLIFIFLLFPRNLNP
jgi:hypothetical protein